MKFPTAILVFCSITLTRATLDADGDVRYAHITFQQDKKSTDSEIVLRDEVTSEILGHACSNSLMSGGFADFPITAAVGVNGNGNLTVGSKTYLVHNNHEHSGGITCTRMYNDQESILRCHDIPLPVTLQLTPVNEPDKPDCFGTGSGVDLDLHRAMDTTHYDSFSRRPGGYLKEAATTPIPVKRSPGSLDERQLTGCSMWYPHTQRLDDAKPHQIYFRKQTSENLYCGKNVGCSMQYTEAKGYTIEWSATAAITEWISGGFAVSESYETSNAPTCDGQAHQTVCVWYKIAHTAYSAQEGMWNECSGFTPNPGSHVRIWSPNTDNKGGHYYCVVGTCRSIGEGYWDFNGPWRDV